MPTPLSRPLRGALVLALPALLSIAWLAAPARASVPIDLRVVDSNGDVLADHTQYTDTVDVKTDPDAECFGDGTGGSGDRVEIKGSTALGAIVDGGSTADRDLKPVSVTDAFDFGLGICGIGDAVSSETGFWLLKQDNVESQTGGDLTKVKRGDDITWFLDPDFSDAPPTELVLEAPERTTPGTPTEVRVFEYDASGARTPAAGVTVTGASQPTDANGATNVDLADGYETLTATRAGAISDAERICAASDIGDCPKEAGGIIGGSGDGEKIVGSDGPDSIESGGGKDEIVTRDGEVDDVTCGGGRDKVKADDEDDVSKSCERVRD